MSGEKPIKRQPSAIWAGNLSGKMPFTSKQSLIDQHTSIEAKLRYAERKYGKGTTEKVEA